MSHTPDRREFLAAVTAAAMGPAFPLSTGPEPGITDTHQHLWDLSRFRLPWLGDDDPAKPNPLRRSFLMSDYQEATHSANVTRTVYMEVNVAAAQLAAEAEYAVRLCRSPENPMVAAVIGGQPQSSEFADYIRRQAVHPEVRGVRTVLHDADRAKGMCLQSQFVRNMRLLGQLGLSFDLCMRPGEVADGARLAERCPDTQFVLDHCGNMPVSSTDKQLRKAWEAGIRAASEQKNMACKISGIVVTAPVEGWTAADLQDVVDVCIDAFGPDRIVFGGDWPVCTLRSTFRQWLEALQQIVSSRPAALRRKLFADNADSVYRLSSLRSE